MTHPGDMHVAGGTTGDECHNAGSDITARRWAEIERDRFFGICPDLIAITGYDGRLERVNPAWTEVLGWAAEELLGRSASDLVAPDDRERLLAQVRRIAAGCYTAGFQTRVLAKNGGYRSILWRATAVVDDRMIYHWGRDITIEVEARQRPDRADAQRLSRQERQVLEHIAAGRTNRQIAEELSLAEKTVRNYVSNLLAKLGMQRRSEAAAFAARLEARGVIPTDRPARWR